ncbi:hypothetical protein MMC31_007991, partial [Peltigera leucophlebia]|nr:hypothetical protein [Peltigera leucophlebia]
LLIGSLAELGKNPTGFGKVPDGTGLVSLKRGRYQPVRDTTSFLEKEQRATQPTSSKGRNRPLGIGHRALRHQRSRVTTTVEDHWALCVAKPLGIEKPRPSGQQIAIERGRRGHLEPSCIEQAIGHRDWASRDYWALSKPSNEATKRAGRRENKEQSSLVATSKKDRRKPTQLSNSGHQAAVIEKRPSKHRAATIEQRPPSNIARSRREKHEPRSSRSEAIKKRGHREVRPSRSEAIEKRGHREARPSRSKAIEKRGHREARPSISKVIEKQGHREARPSRSEAIKKQGHREARS